MVIFHSKPVILPEDTEMVIFHTVILPEDTERLKRLLFRDFNQGLGVNIAPVMIRMGCG